MTNHQSQVTSHDIVISVKNLSKKYRRYGSVADAFKEVIHPFRKKYHDEFWALKDVSFEIKKGESVGIIGRNGSGKSTLLQILCGILQPTSGEVKVHGRVSALLELGAGFHPLFTGRENVYLSGAIMGLTKEEIDARFNDVIEFADIGDFIDQPVKTYSSGMYVRLAFSVAIHVDPAILVVDEALGVGDEAFQRKCFSRIISASEKGATILFVSHSAAVVAELCDHVMFFDHGELLLYGKPKEVVSRYHKLIYAPEDKIETLRKEIRSFGIKDDAIDEKPASQVEKVAEPAEPEDAFYDPDLVSKSALSYEQRGARIENPRITTLDGRKVNVLRRGDEYLYSYDVSFSEDAFSVRFGMMIKTVSGFELGGITTHTQADAIESVEKGAVLSPLFKFRCVLLPGLYFLNSGVVGSVNGVETYLHRFIDILTFRVQPEMGILGAGLIDFSVQEMYEN